MIRRLAAAVVYLALAVGTTASLAPTARAGQYTVTACFDAINPSWQPYRSNGSADAYIDCPGGVSVNGRLTEGMVARNTGLAVSCGLSTT